MTQSHANKVSEKDRLENLLWSCYCPECQTLTVQEAILSGVCTLLANGELHFSNFTNREKRDLLITDQDQDRYLRIGAEAELVDVTLTGCNIVGKRAYLESCLFGRYASVSNDSRVINATLGDKASVGSDCSLDGSTGKINLGNGTTVRSCFNRKGPLVAYTIPENDFGRSTFATILKTT